MTAKNGFREFQLHLLAWTVYVAFQVLTLGIKEGNYSEQIMAWGAQLPSQIIFTYTTLLVLIPKLYLKQRFVLFWTWLLALLLLCGCLHNFGTYYLFLKFHSPETFQQANPWAIYSFLISTFYLITTSGLILSFHLMRYSYKQKVLNQQLISSNLIADLNALKNQINPHFLFNTLNNLYGLTLTEPGKAAEVVMRLSQLMRYMLYESNLSWVPIEKEVEYLKNYIELEKIRYGNLLQLSFRIIGQQAQLQIAPMLLLPFVENAFKHGLSQQLRDPWMLINLEMNEGEIIFKVENSKPNDGTVSKQKENKGIGLKNVVKRLQLIYPGRYELKIFDEGESFLVVMVVKIKNSNGTIK